ncbi:CD209 antigen-like protein C isoform X2 [Lissotriton helveticus]
MSAPSIYQDLNYEDSNVYSMLEDVPRKPQQPCRNVPTLQDKPKGGIQKSSQDRQILRGKKGIANAEVQTLKTNISMNNASSSTSCPVNWIYHSGNCYFFSTDTLNWTDSRDNCRRMDSQLAVIKNGDEETFIEHRGKDRIWIGLSKQQNGQWIWEDGTLLCDRFWQCGEPNNTEGSESCVELFTVSSTSLGWNDDECQKFKFSLCKRPADMLSAYKPGV